MEHGRHAGHYCEIALFEQVVYAAKKAVISGQMQPGEPFPSVRTLSKALKMYGKPLMEITSRNADLWAACIAGAIPRDSYIDTIEAAGFDVGPVRRNDYRFVSERALDACNTYEVQSVSLAAVKTS